MILNFIDTLALKPLKSLPVENDCEDIFVTCIIRDHNC